MRIANIALWKKVFSMLKEKNNTPLYVTYQKANAKANPYRFGTTIDAHKAK